MPHIVASFSVGLGLGLYGPTPSGLLFAALSVALFILIQVAFWLWPLAFGSRTS
jgi:hypothetical protein